MTAKEILVPDIGDFADVDVIEVLVKPGDVIAVEDPLITLESDKASMDIPAPAAGVVKEVKVATGDRVSEGSPILILEPSGATGMPAGAPTAGELGGGDAEGRGAAQGGQSSVAAEAPPATRVPERGAVVESRPDAAAFRRAHASPSVRRIARELGIDLTQVPGTGRGGRVTEADVRAFQAPGVTPAARPGTAAASGAYAISEATLAFSSVPAVDWAKFGEVEVKPMGRINKLSAAHLHRAWLNVPHVTQFDEADITELEAFRDQMKSKAKEQGFALTPLAFVIKACAAALKEYPRFNCALSPDGENLIYRSYYNIGVAVDTPEGLVVPVIRDCDRKGVFALAKELAEVSQRARANGLKTADLQGGCFTVSSLGGIGGTNFTPIINAPEVAILGITRARWRLERVNGEIVDRLIQPLAVSYDHRVIDGAMAARFCSHLGVILSDVRQLIL